MRRRRQIPAGSHRPFGWNYGHNTAIQKHHKMVKGSTGAGGIAHKQIMKADGHDCPDHIFRERITDTGCMTHEDFFLKFPGVGRRNDDITHRPETRGNAVNHFLFLHPPGHQTGGSLHPAVPRRRHRHRGFSSGNGHHIIDGQPIPVNRNGIYCHRLAAFSLRPFSEKNPHAAPPHR